MTDFKAKMHQIRFRLGLRPRPRWGSLQRSPRPPSWICGPLRGRGRGWAGEEEGRESDGPQVTVEPGPIRALLRHCRNALNVTKSVIKVYWMWREKQTRKPGLSAA